MAGVTAADTADDTTGDGPAVTTNPGNPAPTTEGPGTSEGPVDSSTVGAPETGGDSSTGDAAGPMPCLPAEGPVVVGSIDLRPTSPTAHGDAFDANVEPAAGGSFLIEPDGGSGVLECDQWAQDCPKGEKCLPWATDGGTWDSTMCSPVVADPGQLGDPCIAENGGTGGSDDCDLGLMCWGVDLETNEGICAPQCTGSPEAPSCAPPDTACVISNGGVVTLCLPVCNPLAHECPEGDGCYPTGDTITCSPDVSDDGGAPGDPCAFVNVCQDGLWCAPGPTVPGCPEDGCCSPFCTIGDDEACLEGQTCVPFYDGDAPLACLEEVGGCAAPA